MIRTDTLPCLPRRQRGATLVTVLVLLLVMTLLGLASIRMTLLEERMSGNLYDRSLGFQAAEAGLREGENLAATRPAMPAAGVCNSGKCGFPLTNTAAVWTRDDVWAGALSATVDLDGTVSTPQYIVEILADRVPPRGSCTTSGDISESSCTGTERRYRITSRSREEGRSEVMLQSVYAVP